MTHSFRVWREGLTTSLKWPWKSSYRGNTLDFQEFVRHLGTP